MAITRFARTLGTLLASGVPLLTALDIVKTILGNTRLVEVVEEARVDIREGEGMVQDAGHSRIQSREDGYTEKLLSMMRNQFGGHAMKKDDDSGSD